MRNLCIGLLIFIRFSHVKKKGKSREHNYILILKIKENSLYILLEVKQL